MKMEYIKEYVEMWNKAENPKPENDERFIAEFLVFAKTADIDCWNFIGENFYCGYTATLHEYPDHLPIRCVGFEFAYKDNDFVKVFTSNHSGFWVPEYISLRGDDAKELLSVIKEKLTVWAGFGA